jgi:hypothetical protein
MANKTIVLQDFEKTFKSIDQDLLKSYKDILNACLMRDDYDGNDNKKIEELDKQISDAFKSGLLTGIDHTILETIPLIKTALEKTEEINENIFGSMPLPDINDTDTPPPLPPPPVWPSTSNGPVVGGTSSTLSDGTGDTPDPAVPPPPPPLPPNRRNFNSPPPPPPPPLPPYPYPSAISGAPTLDDIMKALQSIPDPNIETMDVATLESTLKDNLKQKGLAFADNVNALAVATAYQNKVKNKDTTKATQLDTDLTNAINAAIGIPGGAPVPAADPDAAKKAADDLRAKNQKEAHDKFNALLTELRTIIDDNELKKFFADTHRKKPEGNRELFAGYTARIRSVAQHEKTLEELQKNPFLTTSEQNELRNYEAFLKKPTQPTFTRRSKVFPKDKPYQDRLNELGIKPQLSQAFRSTADSVMSVTLQDSDIYGATRGLTHNTLRENVDIIYKDGKVDGRQDVNSTFVFTEQLHETEPLLMSTLQLPNYLKVENVLKLSPDDLLAKDFKDLNKMKLGDKKFLQLLEVEKNKSAVEYNKILAQFDKTLTTEQTKLLKQLEGATTQDEHNKTNAEFKKTLTKEQIELEAQMDIMDKNIYMPLKTAIDKIKEVKKIFDDHKQSGSLGGLSDADEKKKNDLVDEINNLRITTPNGYVSNVKTYVIAKERENLRKNLPAAAHNELATINNVLTHLANNARDKKVQITQDSIKQSFKSHLPAHLQNRCEEFTARAFNTHAESMYQKVKGYHFPRPELLLIVAAQIKSALNADDRAKPTGPVTLHQAPSLAYAQAWAYYCDKNNISIHKVDGKIAGFDVKPLDKLSFFGSARKAFDEYYADTMLKRTDHAAKITVPPLVEPDIPYTPLTPGPGNSGGAAA